MSISKTSVIIVNFNSTTQLNKLLKSLTCLKKYVNEIIVIDNNSSDFNSLQTNTSIKLTIERNSRNIGFSAAVNQGIKKSDSDYILLLNPDTFLKPNNNVKYLIKKLDSNKNIGAIGGKILDPISGELKPSANTSPNFLTGLFEFSILKKIFPNNYYSRKFWPEISNTINGDINVTSLCGAFILFRKYLNNKLNTLPSDYFLYLEDVDFGIGINKMGYKVVFSPRSTIYHIGGISSGSKYKTVLKEWYKSRKTFFLKHLPRIQSTVLAILFSVEEYLLKVYHILKHEPFE